MDDILDVADRLACGLCSGDDDLGFDFTMAFQPIVDLRQNTIYGYEALVRGLNEESAYSVIEKVTEDNRYLFDQLCRIKAISLASKLKVDAMLSINFLPNAVYNPERCIRTTLEAARKYEFPTSQIMFEFTEVERIEDGDLIKRIVDYYQKLGFITAIDDFGAGYAGLGLLADFQTDLVKFDMGLIRNISHDHARQCIVSNCINLCRDLNITPLAEGVESREEMLWLRDAGVELMQGYFFAHPGFERLPEVDFSDL